MKLKLISGIYRSAEYREHTSYEGYGIFNEDNKPIIYLSWIAKPDAVKPTDILLHKDGEAKPQPTLGHGIAKIKQMFAELTNAN